MKSYRVSSDQRNTNVQQQGKTFCLTHRFFFLTSSLRGRTNGGVTLRLNRVLSDMNVENNRDKLSKMRQVKGKRTIPQALGRFI